MNAPVGREELVIQTEEPPIAVTTEEEDSFDEDRLSSRLSQRRGPITFNRSPIIPLELQKRPLLSGLSMALSAPGSLPAGGPTDRLTIYLPNLDSLTVDVSPALKIADIIQKILLVHRKENMEPPLHYAQPERYQLRIHDMDGEVYFRLFPLIPLSLILPHHSRMKTSLH